MNKKTLTYFILIIVAAVLCVTVYIVPMPIFGDEEKNSLIKDLILRTIILILIFTLATRSGYIEIFSVFPIKKSAALPIVGAFAVAIVNFPFYSILVGDAVIDDLSFLPLVAVYCIVVAFEEEAFFRGIVYDIIETKVKDKRNAIFRRVIISAAVFSLFHLFNFFNGAGVVDTLLQIGYTFLLGCLFATVKEASGNIYFGIASHTIFNFGGNVIRYAGKGEFFTIQLILPTIIIGVIVGVICILTLLELNSVKDKNYLQES